jgi:hypothetical protein
MNGSVGSLLVIRASEGRWTANRPVAHLTTGTPEGEAMAKLDRNGWALVVRVEGAQGATTYFYRRRHGAPPDSTGAGVPGGGVDNAVAYRRDGSTTGGPAPYHPVAS